MFQKRGLDKNGVEKKWMGECVPQKKNYAFAMVLVLGSLVQ